ncbi:autotransporter domain-containing protein [Stappia sp.]|uniref:autotransporter outer membrane beta-barrel domain-containing protein n=1 Tax=Stappia sp. TaxID=1870903 RepID=UPI0025D02766|nr:autotransporter domain-containing protein [Stappia sp.]
MNALGGVMYDLLQEAVLERCEAGRRRCFLSRLRTGTALAGLSLACVVPMGDAARAAPDVTIDNTVTVPILMDTLHPGGGTLLLTQNGSIVLGGASQSALGTGTSAWTLLIDGAIRSNGPGSGAIASHANDTITVGTTGVIEALDGGTAVFSAGGITIGNSGRIEGEDFGLLVTSGGVSLTNNAGASIEGAIQNPGTGTNYIDNSGSIHNTGNLSVLYLMGDATIYNRAGATISSDSIVIDVQSSAAFLDNAGSITSTNLMNFDTSAVYFTKSGTVINAQTGTMSADTGVWLGNWYEMSSVKATLTNSGSITGTKYHGALFYNVSDASLTNTSTGTLEGSNNGVLFYGLTEGEITNAGTIRGGHGLYMTNDSTLASTGHATILNSGTIEATSNGGFAIAKSSTISYDLTLDTGSNLIGKVQADSGDTLTLKGTGSEDEDLKGFGTLTMAGSAWTLSGGVQADTLDLTSGVLTLTGSDIDFGSISIANTAKLVVNGTFSTPVATTLAGGARLGGTGTVGETTVNAGGILSPGNSIGTINVAGDATFNAGSIYEVEVDPAGTSSDKTIASGAIVINGGTVQHIGFAGSYNPIATYRILEGGTGLTGSFDSVASDYAFLDASLVYDRVNYTVDLTLTRNDISFSDKVSTANQRATAAAAEAAGAGNAVFNAAAALPDNASVLGASFDSLSGEVHASLQSSLVEGARMLRTTVNNRLRSSGAGGAAPVVPILGYAAASGTGSPADRVLAAPAPEAADRWAVWGEGFGSWTRKDGNGNAASVSENTGGFLIGADVAAFEETRLGVFAGYSRTELNVAARGSSASADSYHLGAYGGSSFAAGAGVLSLRGGASYSWSDIESDRTVAVGALVGAPTAGYRAGTAQVFGEAGWAFDMGPGTVEPFAGLAWVGLDTDGFTEAGGAAALAGQSQDMSTAFTTLGARGSASVGLGTLPLELTGALGWRHAFGDVTPLTTASFAGGTPFTVAGAPISRDAAFVEAGASLSLNDSARLSLGYSGQIAEDAREHSLTARLSARF